MGKKQKRFKQPQSQRKHRAKKSLPQTPIVAGAPPVAKDIWHSELTDEVDPTSPDPKVSSKDLGPEKSQTSNPGDLVPARPKPSKKPTKSKLTQESEKLLEEGELENSAINQPYELPFIYYKLSPEYGEMKWICSQGRDGSIRSIFSCDKDPALGEYVLGSLAEAIQQRDNLIEQGFRPGHLPKAKIRVDNKPMNRSQRRRLTKLVLEGRTLEAKDDAHKAQEKAPVDTDDSDDTDSSDYDSSEDDSSGSEDSY